MTLLKKKLKNEDGCTISDEQEVAEAFNVYFIEKIEQLEANINPNLVEDPLVRLKEKMKDNKSTLEFKT